MQPDRHIPLRLYRDERGLLLAEPVRADAAEPEPRVIRMDRALLCAVAAWLVVVPIVLGVLAVLPS